MTDISLHSEKAFIASQYGKEKEYWLKKLSGDLVKSTFPYDYVNRGRDESGPASEPIFVPGGLAARLIEVGTRQDNRVHMILLAALAALLEHYTGSSDIILGVPIYKQEIDSQFINTVVAVRNQLEQPGKMTFKELLLRVRQTLVEAIEFQNYPLETLVYQLGIPVIEKEFPLFDIVVLLENIHQRKYIDHIHCNMVFSFKRSGESIEGRVEYNSFRYKRDTMQRIVSHFTCLLRQALSDINTPLQELNTMSGAEKKQLLTEFNQTEVDYPREKTLHSLYEEQVMRTPDRVALLGQGVVTYRALNIKSNRLARSLRKKGLNHGEIAGIIGERSPRMAVGILAILKAGGAYLAIEPQLPANRISIILADTRTSFLLTQDINMLDEKNRENHTSIILEMDHWEEEAQGQSKEDLEYIHQAGSPAYVIFTSGSTGQPKGVIIRHQGIVNTLTCRRAEYGMTGGDVSLQLFSPSFDGFLTGFFTPVISGAAIVLLKEEEVKNIEIIKRTILENKITHFISVPLLYRGIIENLTPGEASSLKVVTLAGDRISPNILEISKQKNKDLEIVNEYGITEVSVMSTLYRHQERESEIKIGKPIWNTKIYILNPHGELQPIGVFGELCISGAGVAPGYLNNPELTAEKFLTRFYRSHRSYIYKTGDLARWLPDGNIQLAGRIDHQVKIRGNRIEMGEIETHLMQHPQIKEAALVVREDQDNDQSDLCAYFVSDKNLGVFQLRAYLSEKVPDYMIPSYFVQLHTLPRIPGGKIERKSLPDPKKMVNIGRTCEPPANETEKKILQIWTEILNLDRGRIGTADNFFELGGNSISILKVQNRLNKQFNREITMSTMFLYPTIKELAARIHKEPAINKLEHIVKLNNSSSKRNIFIFHPLHGMTYPYKELAVLLEDEFSVYGIQGKGLVSEEPLPATYHDMLEDYIPQLATIQKKGPYILAGYCIGAVLAYEAARILEDENQAVEKLIILDYKAFILDLFIPFFRLKRKLYDAVESIRDFFKISYKSKQKKQAFETTPPKERHQTDRVWGAAAARFLKKSRESNSPAGPHQDQPPAEQDKYENEEERLKQRIEANNKKALLKYRYKCIIDSPILHIRARENHGPRLTKEYWDKMTAGSVVCYEIPGDHDTMLAQPHVEKLAEIIKAAI